MPAEKTPVVLNLGAVLNVERAVALRDDIAAAMNGDDIVDISFSAVEELDLSCLQVLFAALAYAKVSGKELRFVGALSRRVSERLKACGFLGQGLDQAADLETALGLLS